MTLAWNEVRMRASVFAKENADAHYEKGETQTFYNEFFEVFGVHAQARDGVENRSKSWTIRPASSTCSGLAVADRTEERRSDLEKANSQALTTARALKTKNSPGTSWSATFKPSDFIDLQERKDWEFKLADLPQKVEDFSASSSAVKPGLYRPGPRPISMPPS